MKIVCDSCGAKYSIADEKVAGKVFKIRCKRCSQVIVVKGNEGGAEAAPAAPAPGEGVWYIVVDGEQQGPMTPQAIGEMLTAGRVDWEAYTWREGFDGWRPLREITELVDEISPPGVPAPAAAPLAAAPTPKPAAAPAAAKPAADPFAPVGGGLFGAPAAPAPAGGGLFASPAPAPAAKAAAKPAAQASARAGGGVDLFAAAQASAVPSAPAAEDDDVVSSTPGGAGLGAAAATGAAPGLTGQRNENSVLFSLSNLQALAGGPAKPAAAATSGAVKQASSEASGLIDIRALATSPSPSSGASSGVDDILSLGGASAFAPTLGAPVLVPAQQQSGSKLLYVLIALAAVLVLGIIGLIVFIMMGKGEEPVAAGPGMTATEMGGTALGAVGATGTPAMTAGPTTGGPATTAAEEGAEAGGGRRGAKVRRPGGGGGGAQAAPAGGGGAAPATTAPTKRTGGDDLDSLLEGALGGGAAKKQGPAAPAGGGGAGLPAQPSRGDIASGMNSVAGAVRACGGGVSGTATIRVTISGSSGRVTNASVAGPPFAGTPAGSCMARAARGASFPRFSNPSLTVNYPFVVR
jgi:predicted Zn finger-like uncharacterized protein